MRTVRNSGALAAFLLALAAPGCGAKEDVARIDKELAELNARVTKLEGRAPSAAATAGGAAGSTAEVPATSGAGSKGAAAQPAGGTSTTARPPAAGSGGAAGPFDIAKNDALKGRLGRLLVSFADESMTTGSLVQVYAGGDSNDKRSKQVATHYGAFTKEFMPGSYHVAITGRLVEGIPVEAGHDTRVHTGVLRVNASSDTLVKLFEVGAKEAAHTCYGGADLGLPVGPVEVEISGQRDTVTIEDGKITEF